ncbi:hypothetical protein IGI04_008421 [Brassica rapa subsp. trilocularis]|uniref:BURP domain-containing protein n=2 Tax=Brassica rapa subsp. trilocularis TaxID=1813537 RepID=A0ABQ7NMK6_BRACM|nr:uncharacterized protein LOC125608097 [Brassica napus]KAG5377091.1 hypothetical protein IGI04_041687 [Brassica rapa subsp. trilocularis]KAG5385679.1 hypothetical protein IGI04_037149 [Brassica rapa subsp. trilocularis]KAG5404017.1 hypothetical protein IGI04_010136 [Brassica rapa subsp. trilocularis]KAG5412102.1 hypothetical protein IGI04_008421 [Brassica rapa subsp. trilocularis]
MVHHYQPTEQQPVFLPFQNKLPQKNEFVSLSKCFDNMMKHDPSTQMVEDKVCMSNPMNDLISRLILFVSYMSEEDLKKYPSRKNEEPELKDQETSITSGCAVTFV